MVIKLCISFLKQVPISLMQVLMLFLKVSTALWAYCLIFKEAL